MLEVTINVMHSYKAHSEQRSQLQQVKRLASNPRPTTRECVHVVTRGHFRSRDKDGGHTTRIRLIKKTRTALYANFRPLCYIEPELLPTEILRCWNNYLELLLQ